MSDCIISCLEGSISICSNKNAKVLVTTGEGKFFSNGLDLDWLKPTLEFTDYAPTFRKKWNGTIIRLLTFPLPTVAALNG